MKLVIRRVHANELLILRDLAESTFREAWQTQNDPVHFEEYCRKHFALTRLAAEMADLQAEFYFSLLNDRPVAYLKLNLNRTPGQFARFEQPLWPGRAVQIERIYVSKFYQGQRIGENLLVFAERRGRQLDAAWLWLSVWQRAPRAVQFYEKNGFHIFGEEIFWVGRDPQIDWLMRKRLL
ncbi:MAG: GNAT family N-acetyltransferase [Saprospiraceae bacterium]|nr:GNAT family N-acetyltransferase [Saprospiraceae bacterium]MDW8484429.1 GNAT family N-acetyltransferase [Saprospiraceae bacterium]